MYEPAFGWLTPPLAALAAGGCVAVLPPLDAPASVAAGAADVPGAAEAPGAVVAAASPEAAWVADASASPVCAPSTSSRSSVPSRPHADNSNNAVAAIARARTNGFFTSVSLPDAPRLRRVPLEQRVLFGAHR